MASDYSFNLTPPRRPSLADLGGAAKQDDAAYPPDPLTMVTAQNWNQFARFIEGAGKFQPFVAIEVRFAAGVPYIAAVTSMRSTLEVTSFVAPTDNGAGDTTVSFAAIAGQFPPANMPPEAYLIGDGDMRYPTTDTSVANTVRVRTRNSAGVLTDFPFVVRIYGK